MFSLGKTCDVCYLTTITRGKRCKECGPFYAAAERAYYRCKKSNKLSRFAFASIRDMALYLKFLYEVRQKNTCFYTNEKMYLGNGPKGMNISVERKNVNGNYDHNNTVLCLSLINKMKNEIENEDVFYEICLHIIRGFYEKKISEGEVSYADIISQFVQMFKVLSKKCI